MNASSKNTDLVETAYRMLANQGWADHYRCGWGDGPDGPSTIPPDDGVCGKEWHEREAVAQILAAISPVISAAAISDAADDLPDSQFQTVMWLTARANAVRNSRSPYNYLDDAEVAAAALREAADAVQEECSHSKDACFCTSADWLRARAAEGNPR